MQYYQLSVISGLQHRETLEPDISNFDYNCSTVELESWTELISCYCPVSTTTSIPKWTDRSVDLYRLHNLIYK